jgi:predicted glycosyltransferase
MKIIFDLHHPADINFFKNSIHLLLNKGINIELTVRTRGRLIKILQKELPDIPYMVIGKHHSGISMKLFGGFKRELELLFYLKKINYDVGIAFGPEICFVSKILGKPSIVFGDDYEYKLSFYLSKFAATCFSVPDCIPATGGNLYKFKGLKELAYLHPKYFKPNKKILDQYGLKSNEYVFLREIANTSLNYRNISSWLHTISEYLRKMNFQVLISLEDKSLINKFKDCIVLEEPIEDIYSLLCFAALTISSGDTMARESCLVGTPTIYTGGRDMYVNNELIRKKCMFKIDNPLNVIPMIKYIVENDLKNKVIETINYNIKYEWEDVTEIIVDNILGLKS